MHLERGALYMPSPGIDVVALRATGVPVTVFDAPNLFFGGGQAVGRDPHNGTVSGGADGRRGGAVARGIGAARPDSQRPLTGITAVR